MEQCSDLKLCRVQAENLGGRNSCLAVISVLVPKAYKGPEFIEALRAVLTGKTMKIFSLASLDIINSHPLNPACLTEQGTVSLECKVIGKIRSFCF